MIDEKKDPNCISRREIFNMLKMGGGAIVAITIRNPGSGTSTP